MTPTGLIQYALYTLRDPFMEAHNFLKISAALGHAATPPEPAQYTEETTAPKIQTKEYNLMHVLTVHQTRTHG